MGYKGAITEYDRTDFLVLIASKGKSMTKKQMLKGIRPYETIGEFMEYMDAVLEDCLTMGYLERDGKHYWLTEKGFNAISDFYE